MERAVLFDCDGVLVDSECGLSRIATHVLNHHFDIPAVPEDFIPYLGTGENTYIGEVVRKYGHAYIPRMQEVIYSQYLDLASQYVIAVEGAKALVLKLRMEGYKIAVASSANWTKLDKNLSIVGLASSDFDARISGDDVHKQKPDPEIFLLAARRCGILPANCIVVEDAASGVLSGKSAGMTVIGFTSTVTAEVLKSAGADITASTMKELDEVIHGIR